MTNALVNPQGQKTHFMNLIYFFSIKMKSFKQFHSDQGFSLQETDEMFKLHALLVDALAKVRRVMNRVVISRKRKGKHPIKDSLFDILSLSDQLYRSRSIYPEEPHLRKIYFLENPMPNLITEGTKHLHIAIKLFNELVRENKPPTATDVAEETEIGSTVNNPTDLDASLNPLIDELFLEARSASSMTSDLGNIFL